MSYRARARTPARRTSRIPIAGLLAVIVVTIGVVGYRSLASSPATTSSVAVVGDARGSALGEADGAVPDGTTVFDDGVPGVAKLDPSLLRALRRAATAAMRDRVVFFVDSGWRSPAYQEHLLEQAVSEYGSRDEAARWVATPNTSAHVSGNAVDIGHSDATAWLAAHGSRYGLCRIYGNEPWHFELRPDAVRHGCPPRYPDAAHDPRLQR
jgi:hypothetical protein